MGVEVRNGRLFCNTADVAFGPDFGTWEAGEAFIRWLRKTHGKDPRESDLDLETLKAEWETSIHLEKLDAEIAKVDARMADAYVVAVALSLYAYNVGPLERAKALYDHFDGACMEVDELLLRMLPDRVAHAATELPAPTAAVYVDQALARYAEQARKRVEYFPQRTSTPAGDPSGAVTPF